MKKISLDDVDDDASEAVLPMPRLEPGKPSALVRLPVPHLERAQPATPRPEVAPIELPNDLKAAFALLEKLNRELPERTTKETRAKNARLEPLKAHIHQLQQCDNSVHAVPMPVTTLPRRIFDAINQTLY
jgi:hypothetical protein